MHQSRSMPPMNDTGAGGALGLFVGCCPTLWLAPTAKEYVDVGHGCLKKQLQTTTAVGIIYLSILFLPAAIATWRAWRRRDQDSSALTLPSVKPQDVGRFTFVVAAFVPLLLLMLWALIPELPNLLGGISSIVTSMNARIDRSINSVIETVPPQIWGITLATIWPIWAYWLTTHDQPSRWMVAVHLLTTLFVAVASINLTIFHGQQYLERVGRPSLASVGWGLRCVVMCVVRQGSRAAWRTGTAFQKSVRCYIWGLRGCKLCISTTSRLAVCAVTTVMGFEQCSFSTEVQKFIESWQALPA